MAISKVYTGSASGTVPVKRLYAPGPKGKSVLVYEKELEIVSWANGTVEQIQAMLDAADAGVINLEDYWSIGDARTVTFTATTLGATSMDWVLTDFNGTTSGGTPYHAVIHTKDLFPTAVKMKGSDTNVGSWRDSWIRSSIIANTIYPNLSSEFKSLIKEASIVSGAGNASNTTQTTSDYIWLFAEKEVIGTTYGSGSAEAALCTQMKYFETSSNRIKRQNGSVNGWWLRSPYAINKKQFCMVATNGSTTGYEAANDVPISVAAII